MARLLEAVRPDARLVLVGDPQQLASVEAGAVLGDIVGPAADLPQRSPRAGGASDTEVGTPVSDTSGVQDGGIADSIVVLRRVHRFGEVIGNVADAIRRGDADATVYLLRADGDEVAWIEADVTDPAGAPSLPTVRAAAVDAGRRCPRGRRKRRREGRAHRPRCVPRAVCSSAWPRRRHHLDEPRRTMARN